MAKKEDLDKGKICDARDHTGILVNVKYLFAVNDISRVTKVLKNPTLFFVKVQGTNGLNQKQTCLGSI